MCGLGTITLFGVASRTFRCGRDQDSECQPAEENPGGDSSSETQFVLLGVRENRSMADKSSSELSGPETRLPNG